MTLEPTQVIPGRGQPELCASVPSAEGLKPVDLRSFVEEEKPAVSFSHRKEVCTILKTFSPKPLQRPMPPGGIRRPGWRPPQDSAPPAASAGPTRFTPSLGVPADSTLPESTSAVSSRAQGEVATHCLLPCPFPNLVHGVTRTEGLRPETREPSSHSARIQSKASPSLLPPMPLEPTLLSASRLDKTATSIPTDAVLTHSPASFLYSAATGILHDRKQTTGAWLRALPFCGFPSTWHRAP